MKTSWRKFVHAGCPPAPNFTLRFPRMSRPADWWLATVPQINTGRPTCSICLPSGWAQSTFVLFFVSTNSSLCRHDSMRLVWVCGTIISHNISTLNLEIPKIQIFSPFILFLLPSFKQKFKVNGEFFPWNWNAVSRFLLWCQFCPVGFFQVEFSFTFRWRPETVSLSLDVVLCHKEPAKGKKCP